MNSKNSKLNFSALVVVACLFYTSITSATPVPRTDDLLARDVVHAAPASLQEVDIHLYPSSIPRNLLVHNLAARMAENGIPSTQESPVDTTQGGRKRKRQPNARQNHTSGEGPAESQQEVAEIPNDPKAAQRALSKLEEKVENKEINKTNAEITLDEAIGLRAQVSIGFRLRVDSVIVKCIGLDPELEAKLSEKVTQQLGSEIANYLIPKLKHQIRTAMGEMETEVGSGAADPPSPPPKRQRILNVYKPRRSRPTRTG